jgi:hypothetical protein
VIGTAWLRANNPQWLRQLFSYRLFGMNKGFCLVKVTQLSTSDLGIRRIARWIRQMIGTTEFFRRPTMQFFKASANNKELFNLVWVKT